MNLMWEETNVEPESQQSESSSEVQGESLLGSAPQVQVQVQVQVQSGSVQQQVPVQSGSVQQQVPVQSGPPSEVHTEPGSVSGCEEFGCFPLDAQVEVWWNQQPVSYLLSPHCSAHRRNPFELSGELQVVMFGKTDDQVSLTEQARLYVEP